MSRPILVVIDGHALVYRQYFGMKNASFATKSGEPTTATFGFTRVLLDLLLKEDKPDYIAVSFDMGLSGRETIYPEYKANRADMEEDMVKQMDRIQQVVQAFNIPLLALEGYEADDIIGTVAQQAEAQGVHVHIVTGDRDLLQLLGEHVTAQLPSRQGNGTDEVYDVARFTEKYGLRPDQLVDLKALMGDTSDNIPGVKGIGEKGATTLLQQYGSLDNIYAHLVEMKGATRQKLIDGREMAYLSRTLATIRKDVPITLNLDACISHEYDVEVVLELFRELEFRSFSDRLVRAHREKEEAAHHEVTTDGAVNTVIVNDEAGLSTLIRTLNKAKAIVWDVETTSVDQMAAELVGIALAVDGQTGYYIPVGHRAQGAGTLFEQPTEKQLPLQRVLEALREPLTNPNIPKIAHNASYDLVVLQRYGIDVQPITFDTMVAEWLRDPNSKFLGLKAFALQYLYVEMTEISELIGSGKKQITMAEVPIEKAAPYAAADAAITYRAAELLRPELEREGLDKINDTLEMPLIPVIASMERAGVALDVPYLDEMSQRLAAQLHELEQEIYRTSGYGEFNINSPKQLNEVLFDKLGLSAQGVKKTTHGYSTDAATLDILKDEHEVVRLILDYRELSKLKGTYVDALPQLVNPQTGRVHTSYNQTGASTGRMSSSNPNLQNIPIRTEVGREVRRAFIAPEGKLLLSVDYSQIELRVLAHISQDATLLEAFAQGQDIHAATAAAVYGVPVNEVTYEQRSFAKRVNFGLIYGMGAHRLARDSDLTFAEAEAFIKRYFDRLPRVGKYIEDTKRAAREPEGLKTLFGRRRLFPALQSSSTRASHQIQAAEERAAINMPIQGTAADIMKRAMIDVYAELTQRNLGVLMILQVHDELVFEVPESKLKETRDLVVRIMESAYQLDAPLKANAQAGTNWRDMTPV